MGGLSAPAGGHRNRRKGFFDDAAFSTLKDADPGVERFSEEGLLLGAGSARPRDFGDRAAMRGAHGSPATLCAAQTAVSRVWSGDAECESAP